MSSDKKYKDGQITIITALILTTVSIIVASVVSNSSFLGRFDTQFFESKTISKNSSEGCVEYAKLQIALNSSYTGGETVNVSDYSCEVVSVSDDAGNKVIKTTSNVNDKVTNFRVVVDGETLDTVDFKEVDKF